MIVLRSLGGLGNQLFSYAAARRLALISNSELIIDHISGFRYDYCYKRSYQLDHFNIPCRKASASERLEPFGRIRRRVLINWSRCLPFDKRSYLVQAGFDFDNRLLDLRPTKKLYLEGYWQSELYFSDFQSQIRADLCICPPTDSANLRCAASVRQRHSVAVHVRFFNNPDTPAFSSNENIDIPYYTRAVEIIESRLPEAHYFLFSDHPDAARSFIPLPDHRVTMIHHNRGDDNAYADLWLMRQCEHFIIANSTFSWWGAWLASNPNKIVIAPGFEKREGSSAWGVSGLIPDGWIKL
jgi:hypothetical protein